MKHIIAAAVFTIKVILCYLNIAPTATSSSVMAMTLTFEGNIVRCGSRYRITGKYCISKQYIFKSLMLLNLLKTLA